MGKTIDKFLPVITPVAEDTFVCTQGGVTRKQTTSQVMQGAIVAIRATDVQAVEATSITCLLTPANLTALKAIDAQVTAGTSTTYFITPSNLPALKTDWTSSDAQAVASTATTVFLTPSNLSAIKAVDAQLTAGTSNTCFITPSNIPILKASDAQAIGATATTVLLTPANIAALKASNAQAITGTATTCFVTPANLTAKLAATTASTATYGLIKTALDSDGITGTDNGKALTSANLKAVLQGLGYAINTGKGTDIASAGAINLNAATGNYVDITGTTGITTLGTGITGQKRTLNFKGILPLTYNATSFIIPSGTSITTAVGDVAEVVSLGGANWKVTSYTKADGTAISTPSGGSYSGKFFEAYASGSQSIAPTTATLVAINTEIYDASSVFDNSGGNYKLIIPNGESWFVYANMGMDDVPATVIAYLYIYKNGGEWKKCSITGNTHALINFLGATATGNGTDYFQAYVWHSHVSNLNTRSGASEVYFGGYRVA